MSSRRRRREEGGERGKRMGIRGRKRKRRLRNPRMMHTYIALFSCHPRVVVDMSLPVVVVVAIAMSFQVLFLSFCRPVEVLAVMLSSRVVVTVAVVISRSSCWCRVLVFLSS